MTLEEKASQLVNQARAIPRLNVPACDWWCEALHGVAVDGTTEGPEPPLHFDEVAQLRD
jgi:beta-glucosidase